MALFGRKKTVEAPEEAPVVAAPVLPGRPEANQEGLRSIEDHRDFLLAQVAPLRPFGIGALDAWGLTLCENIVSDIDLPTYTSATAEGYAVRASDLVGASSSRPVRLPVLDTLDTPRYRGAPLTSGTSVRVAPGAPIPDGADAVVPLELTDGGDETVTINSEIRHHANLRLLGSDIADGAKLLNNGQTLDAGSIGLLAEVGIDKVLVRPRPRVVVLTVGKDLVQPGLPLTARSQRYDATTTLIAAAARADGAQVYAAGTFGENADQLLQVLSDQLIRSDLIIVIGGLEGDQVLREVLPKLGRADFCHVAMHPGSAQGFALIGDDDTPVIGLPSGSASAFVGYQAFGRPLVHKLAGGDPKALPVELRPARVALTGTKGLTELIPALRTPRGVEPVGRPGAEVAHDLARAQLLIVLPADVESVRAHDDVECWVLSEPSR